MAHREQWLEWAIELQALAQAGLFYGRDKFDLERYARIREIAAEIVAKHTDLSSAKVADLFCCETGYQTPKLDSRAAVFQEEKILLVQESDLLWALPGGWVDVDLSVGENVQCTPLGGSFQPNLETLDSGFFALDELPALSVEKTTEEQIRMCFDAYHTDCWNTRFE